MNRRVTMVILVGLLFSVPACNQDKPLPTEVTMLSVPGGEMGEAETALRQEQSLRNDLLSMIRGPLEVVRGIPVGDPATVDAVREELAQLSSNLLEKLALEDEKLDAPREAIRSAEAVLASRNDDLQYAISQSAALSGVFLVSPEGRRCGEDGCGGSCGECSWSELCVDRSCRCMPSCEGKECGDDGCGGICGTGKCAGDSYCSKEGLCLAKPTERECRKSCRGEPGGWVTVTKSVRDHGARTSRRYAPWRVGSQSELEGYQASLEERTRELDALLSSADSTTKAQADTEARLEATRMALNTTKDEHKTLKRELAVATKEARKAAEDTKEAAEARKSELAQSLADKAASIDVLKTTVKELSTTLRDLNKQLRQVKREQPDIAEGREKINAELSRVEKMLARWREAESKVSAKRQSVATAESALQTAKQTLETVTEQVEAAKEAIAKEMAPALEELNKKLASLALPALTDAIGTQPANGLNVESTRILALRNEARLAEVTSKAQALLDSRREAYSALTPEQQELYPNWPKEMEALENYIRFLEALEQSTTRQLALETRLVELRKALIEPKPASEIE